MSFDLDFFTFVKQFGLGPSHSLYTDTSDFINGHITVGVYVIIGILVSTKTLLGSAIECWVPAEFSDSWEAYAKQICWVEGMYWVSPSDVKLPKQIEREIGSDRRIHYYQWVTLFLLGMAILAYLPTLIWKWIACISGIHIKSITEHLLSVYNQTDSTSREKTIHETGRFLWIYLRDSHSGIRQKHLCSCLPKGSTISSFYLLFKLLSLLTLFVQLFLCWYFIGHSSPLFGLHLAINLLYGNQWSVTGNFPRVAMCDFQVRSLGNIQSHSVQCTLPINMVNEKFFVFLWFYLCLAILFTVISTTYWLIIIISCGPISIRLVRDWLIRNSVNWGDDLPILDCTHKSNVDQNRSAMLHSFVTELLCRDGMFVIRLVRSQVGDFLVGQMVTWVWRFYRQSSRKRAEGCSEVDGLNLFSSPL